MASLAKPQGAGDTKKVRRMRKKLEGKAAGGSISTVALLQQCTDVGVHVKPLLTPHLERHGRQPTLSAKEARHLVLHCASHSPAPRVAEVRNLPAVRAVLVVALTGVAAMTTTTATAVPPTAEEVEGEKLTVPPSTPVPAATNNHNPLDGFTDGFKQRFRLCAGLRISSGGFTVGPADGGVSTLDSGDADGGSGGGGWLKSLADAFLYAPLGEDREACPAGPFSGGKKRKNAGGHGGGGRKKKSKSNAKRHRRLAQAGQQQPAECSGGEGVSPEEKNGAAITLDNSSGEENGDDNDNHGDGEHGDDDDGSATAAASPQRDDGAEKSTEEAMAMASEMETEGQRERHQNGGEVSASGDEGEEEEENGVPPLPAIETYILSVKQLTENGFPVPSSATQDVEERAIAECPEQNEPCGPPVDRISGEVVLPTAKAAKDVIERAPKMAELEGHVQTQPLSNAGAPGGGDAGGVRVFGLDCEMCVTEAGLELTRVTLVDAQHKVLLDELVKPDNNIVDYVTR